MNDSEYKRLRRKQLVASYRKNFGLPEYLWDNYQLTKFEVSQGNELAFRTALEFLMIPPELKLAEEIYSNEDAIDVWYDRQPVTHHFLTFVGECGRGKTHLAIGLGIWQITKVESSAVYWQVAELLSALRRSFEDDPELSYKEIVQRCKSVDLLIFDDLGMQKNTDWVLEQLDSLVDYRYVNELKTIFTTNLKPNRLPPRIASRIREGEIATLTCGDYRELKARRRIDAREVNAEVEGILKPQGGS